MKQDVKTRLIFFIPDHFKTEEIYIKFIEKVFYHLENVLGKHKTQEICNEIGCKDPCLLQDVFDHYKTPGICDKAVHEDSCSL